MMLGRAALSGSPPAADASSNWLNDAEDFGVWFTGSDPTVIAASNYDLMLVDPDEQTTEEITAMRAMPGGGTRRLVAYLTIGEAVNYRWYWQPAWASAPPSWLGVEGWPGVWRVQYWTQEWKDIIYGSPTSSIGRILAAGFDGVFLSGVDTYQTWQAEGRATAENERVQFVAELTAYAKSVNPNFKIISLNADPLLLRSDYLNAIDAACRHLMWYNDGVTPRSQGDLDWILPKIANARSAGKRILNIEEVSAQADIDIVYANNAANGDLTYIGPSGFGSLWNVTPTPSSNWLNDLSNFGVWLTLSDPAVIGASEYDLMIVDPDEQTPQEMPVLRARPGGGERKLAAYLSTGEAVNYRWYWQPAWNTTPPSWLGTENPNWPGAFRVQYWQQEWKDIVYAGGATSSLGRILAAGFDGAFLDVVDTYAYWEGLGRTTAADEMVQFVTELTSYARSVNPNFKIIAQNSPPLLLRNDYLAAIDAVSVESMWFLEEVPLTQGDHDWLLPKIANARTAGKRILNIEYTDEQAQINTIYANNAQFNPDNLTYIGPRALNTLWHRGSLTL